MYLGLGFFCFFVFVFVFVFVFCFLFLFLFLFFCYLFCFLVFVFCVFCVFFLFLFFCLEEKCEIMCYNNTYCTYTIHMKCSDIWGRLVYIGRPIYIYQKLHLDSILISAIFCCYNT